MKLTAQDFDWGEAVDATVFEAIALRLMMPISNFPAFKMGLIDGQGNIKKQPRSREEKRALSFVDRLAIMFKRYLGARANNIYTEYRLNRANPLFLQALIRGGTLRFNKYYNMNMGWNFNTILQEEIKRKRKKKLNSLKDKKQNTKRDVDNTTELIEEEIEGE